MDIQDSHRDRRNRRILYTLISLIAVLFILCVILVLLVLRKRSDVEQIADRIHPPVVSIRAKRENLSKTMVVNGYLEAEDEVDIIPMVSGTVTAISVEEGQTVKRGDVLATIDSQALKLNMEQAENAYHSAESAYLRIKNLHEKEMTSTQNLEKAEGEYNRAGSVYESAKLQYEYSFVNSPIEGIVMGIHTTRGALAGGGRPIMTISNPDHLIINNQIPEIYYEQFFGRIDTIPLSITRPYSGSVPIAGHILSMGKFISPETKTFTVKCSVDSELYKLVPGMFVKTGFILEEQRDVFTLPFDILVGGNKLWYLGDKVEGDSLYRAAFLNFEPRFFNSESFMIDEELSRYTFLKEGQDFIFEGQIIYLKSGPGPQNEDF